MVKTVSRKMPDGTVCRTGPGCKRHSPSSSSLKKTITEQLNIARKAVKEKDKVLPFPTGNKRLGLNESNPDWALDLYNQSETIENTLDDETSNSLRWYRMSGYVQLNGYLRGGREGHEKALREVLTEDLPSDYVNKDYENVKEHVERIDTVFEKVEPFDKPVVVYRAVKVEDKIPDGMSALQYAKDKFTVGSTVTENGYVSTSADSDYMSFYGRRRVKVKGQHIVYEIIAKKGLPAFERGRNDTPARPRDGDIQSFEREILLDRGSKFRVIGVKNVSFEHSYTRELQGHGIYVNDCPSKVVFPVVQLEQIF